MNKILSVNLLILTLMFISCKNDKDGSNPITAKPKEILAIDPGYSQGYLVLNPSKYQNLVYWKIDIISPKEANEKSISLPKGKNYWKIPEKLLQDNNRSKVKISGFDSSDNTVIEVEPFMPNTTSPSFIPDGWPDLELGCTWKCVSSSYAWEIRLWHEEDNESSYLLSLHHTFDYYNEEEDLYIPYYSWMTEDAFNNYCNSIGLPDLCTEPYGIQRIGPRAGDGKYGVAKDLGPWEGSSIATPIDNLLNGTFDCGWERSWAIETLNIYGEFTIPSGESFPEVSCIPLPGPGGIGIGNEPIGGSNNCIGQVDFGEEGFWGYLGSYWKCMKENGWNSDWVETFDSFQIINLNNPNVDKTIISPSRSFDEKGNWSGNSFDIENSLYLIGFIFNDGRYFYSITETPSSKNNIPSKKVISQFFNE